MFMQNIIKLGVVVHQLLCAEALLPYLAMVKNPKIQSCDLDLWPMTLRFFGFRAVVKEHVHTTFHRAMCSGSWVIVHTERKLRWTQYGLSLPCRQ